MFEGYSFGVFFSQEFSDFSNGIIASNNNNKNRRDPKKKKKKKKKNDRGRNIFVPEVNSNYGGNLRWSESRRKNTALK